MNLREVTRKSVITPLFLVILILFPVSFYFISTLKGKDGITVKHVIDGDSIILQDIESTNIRYLSINAPEVLTFDSPGDPLSEEAKNLNKKLVEGKGIRLVFDKERFDPYGRTLAYIFVDDLFVNEELVRKGLARAYIISPNDKYAKRILEAQEEAKRNGIGIWSEIDSIKPPSENSHFLIHPSNASRHIDQRVVVRGKITDFRKSDKVLVLRMENEIDIVLFPDSWGNFSFFDINPGEYYMGKPVEVIGKVKMYRGRPNIIVSHPISIRVLT
jgi:micrococcal nuclease